MATIVTFFRSGLMTHFFRGPRNFLLIFPGRTIKDHLVDDGVVTWAVLISSVADLAISGCDIR